MSARIGKNCEAKHVSAEEVPLTLVPTIEVSLANHKNLSNCPSPDFMYLPTRDDSDWTIKHPSTNLNMCGIFVALMVLCVLTRVHVGWWKCQADWCAVYIRFHCDCQGIGEDELESTNVCPTGTSKGLVVVHSVD